MANLTPKQERFCQLYIELGNASEAYRQSYDADSMNENTVNRKAKELLDNGKITARLELIRKEHSKRHNITVDSLLIELEEARKMALDLNIQEKPQVSAAVTATMGKAKLLGLDKQVVELTGENTTNLNLRVVFENDGETSTE
ncbi:terminase small subunit [Acinetobacter indicus]|uniref:terminase small subunit n=1 Tax=Acinetobacter indicus TaxID=756892 RepID=UPI001444559B|nr:terminase small subunit [Acinetobacter indicus]